MKRIIYTLLMMAASICYGGRINDNASTVSGYPVGQLWIIYAANTNNSGATRIGVYDLAGNYTGTTAEAVLGEVANSIESLNTNAVLLTGEQRVTGPKNIDTLIISNVIAALDFKGSQSSTTLQTGTNGLAVLGYITVQDPLNGQHPLNLAFADGRYLAAASSGAFLAVAANLSDLSSVSAAQSNLSLVINVDVQAWDPDLDKLAVNDGGSLTNLTVGPDGSVSNDALSGDVILEADLVGGTTSNGTTAMHSMGVQTWVALHQVYQYANSITTGGTFDVTTASKQLVESDVYDMTPWKTNGIRRSFSLHPQCRGGDSSSDNVTWTYDIYYRRPALFTNYLLFESIEVMVPDKDPRGVIETKVYGRSSATWSSVQFRVDANVSAGTTTVDDRRLYVIFHSVNDPTP